MLEFGNSLLHATLEEFLFGTDSLLDVHDWLLKDQLPADSNHVQSDADPSQLQAIPAAGMQPSPVASPADMPLSTTADLEFAEMVRVATECGEDDGARTTWSEEEHKELLRFLDLYVRACLLQFGAVLIN
jgi:hypothetical protein